MDFDLTLTIEVLRRSPATLRALLDGLSEPWIRGTEGPETFSPFDVVGHLIDGEETDWIPRASIILAQGPSLRFEPYDRFRHRTRNPGRSAESLLAEFARLRAANLQQLESWMLTETELVGIVHPPATPADLSAPPADAVKTRSGLAYRVLRPGSGDKHPSRRSTVRV